MEKLRNRRSSTRAIAGSAGSRLNESAPTLVALLAAALLVADAGRIALGYFPHPVHERPVTSSMMGSPAGGDLAALRGLFGELPSESAPRAASAALTLRGTVTLGDVTHGFAIIAVGPTPALYGVGEDVDGAILKEVYADHVILARGPSLETLMMAKPDSAFVLSGNAASPAGIGADPQPVERLPNAGEIKSRVEKAIAPLSSVISARPLMNGELYRALVVKPGADALTFQRLGLKAGDAIMAVNGKQVNPDTFDELTRDLQSGRPVRVYVDRPGEGPEEVKLNPKALASFQQR